MPPPVRWRLRQASNTKKKVLLRRTWTIHTPPPFTPFSDPRFPLAHGLGIRALGFHPIGHRVPWSPIGPWLGLRSLGYFHIIVRVWRRVLRSCEQFYCLNIMSNVCVVARWRILSWCACLLCVKKSIMSGRAFPCVFMALRADGIHHSISVDASLFELVGRLSVDVLIFWSGDREFLGIPHLE